MTWEEAITRTEEVIKFLKDQGWDVFDQTSLDILALKMVLTALRPVSRERVEKMKKAPVEVEYDELYAPTYKCPECGFWNTGRGNFCRNCGCLHTDEAVQMVMERMEALHAIDT